MIEAIYQTIFYWGLNLSQMVFVAQDASSLKNVEMKLIDDVT